MNTLTTVHNNGIVNRVQIVEAVDDQGNKTQVQLIWNGLIQCTVVGQNEEPIVHGAHANKWSIRDFRAIYLDGIMIVKRGRVWPRKRWFDIF